MRFGEKVSAVAELNGLELKEIARAAGIPYDSLIGYTRSGSDRVPGAPRGIALAKALGVAPEWLFDDTLAMPPWPYHEPPPVRIHRWPPSGLTWAELQVAIVHWLYNRLRDDRFKKLEYKQKPLGYYIWHAVPNWRVYVDDPHKAVDLLEGAEQMVESLERQQPLDTSHLAE